jgi:uncharacterized protein (DUF2062 family)
MVRRLGAWVRANAPDREALASSRWLGPFGKHVVRSELWRFTRRSVPRGVAVGLLIGIFLMIPGLQMIGAALMCVPVRGNIPIAAAMTFLSMPATTPFILVGSILIGNRLLGWHADIGTFYGLYERGATIREWLGWLASDAAPSLLLGLLVVASGAALLGYLIAAFGWRLWIARKWRARGQRAAALPQR